MAKKPAHRKNLIQYSAVDFLKELGSDSTSPGGGAAAALTGALGVSLIEMVSRINERRALKKESLKKPSAAYASKLASIVKIRKNFGSLIKKDTEAFLKISSFSKEERSGETYEKALKNGANEPLEMTRLAHQAMTLGESEIDRTSRWLASDLAEAGILLEASFHAARLNVEINLRSIQDALFISKTRNELDQLQSKVLDSKKKLLEVLSK